LPLESAAIDPAVKTKQKKQMESGSLRKTVFSQGLVSHHTINWLRRAGGRWQAKAPNAIVFATTTHLH
jgi:hypothetical protein